MQSILQNNRVCYITGSPCGLHKHHIYEGSGRRHLSEQYGCWIWLRGDWHNGARYGVHYDQDLDLRLKQTCQEAFERSHTRQDFMRIFGRSYL